MPIPCSQQLHRLPSYFQWRLTTCILRLGAWDKFLFGMKDTSLLQHVFRHKFNKCQVTYKLPTISTDPKKTSGESPLSTAEPLLASGVTPSSRSFLQGFLGWFLFPKLTILCFFLVEVVYWEFHAIFISQQLRKSSRFSKKPCRYTVYILYGCFRK